jgi:hypothetical protein
LPFGRVPQPIDPVIVGQESELFERELVGSHGWSIAATLKI